MATCAGLDVGGGGRSSSGCKTAQELRDGEVVRARRRPYLAPRALLRILVRAKADQTRAVSEPVALDLVIAHLDDELRPHRLLAELAGAPAVRLREAPLGR